MARNLRKFATKADYDNAELVLPAVSWIVSGDTLAYDKTEPEPVVANSNIVITYTASNRGEDIVLFNEGSSGWENEITGITVNAEAIDPIVAVLDRASVAGTLYTVEYSLADNVEGVGEAFTGDLGAGGSNPSILEMYIPEQINGVNYLPNNEITNLVIMATTPPESEVDFSSLLVDLLFVPDESLNDYRNSGWSSGEYTILPLSAYDGNLPIYNYSE